MCVRGRFEGGGFSVRNILHLTGFPTPPCVSVARELELPRKALAQRQWNREVSWVGVLRPPQPSGAFRRGFALDRSRGRLGGDDTFSL